MYTESNDTKVRLAMPVLYDEGLQSEVSGHFGKSPGFIIVNSDGSEPVYLDTQSGRGPEECAPIEAIRNLGGRLILAKSMGRGALQRCQEYGLKILEAKGETVAEVLMSMMTDQCPDFSERALCGHHDEHHSHGHDH